MLYVIRYTLNIIRYTL